MARFGSLTDARASFVLNEYGPTETTVWSLTARLDRDDVHLGRPLANTKLFVLGADGQPVPMGVPGELFIGGAGLARGYSTGGAV